MTALSLSNGGFALVQYGQYNAAPVIEIAVADSGIGIRKSLAKNTELAGIESDCAAIKLAMIEGTTSVGDKYRGLGLAYVVDQVQLQRQRSMVFRSGNGIIGNYIEFYPKPLTDCNPLGKIIA